MAGRKRYYPGNWHKNKGVSSAEAFSKELTDILNDAGAMGEWALKEAVDEQAKETRAEIIKNARAYGWDRSYTDDFSIRKSTDRFGYHATIFHDSPEYRLVHLLEFGHRITHAFGVGGPTQSPAFPHIAPAVADLASDLVNRVKEKLEE